MKLRTVELVTDRIEATPAALVMDTMPLNDDQYRHYVLSLLKLLVGDDTIIEWQKYGKYSPLLFLDFLCGKYGKYGKSAMNMAEIELYDKI